MFIRFRIWAGSIGTAIGLLLVNKTNSKIKQSNNN